jgi:hypothetical protein
MRNKTLLNINSPIFVYWLILTTGYSLAGWLLAAFNTPLWVWLGTFLIIVYLAKSGTEGLLIANIWVVFIMFLVTIFKRWPQIWPSHIPEKDITLWSAIIMLLWSLAILLMMGLALTHQAMKLRGFTSILRLSILVSLTSFALGVGWLIFQAKLISLSPLVS